MLPTPVPDGASEGATDGVRVVDHLIVGAGFAGLAAAIKLDEAGERDFVVLDKDSDVGGTWHVNTYPGAECDVPSQLYSYSFALNPDWSKVYSPQAEIQAYIRDVAARSGTLDRFVFGTEVTDATWEEDQQRWIVTTEGPDGPGCYAARTLVVGAGGLSEPRLPDIDGIDDFAGETFHSARWNHDADLAGKRVAVIGTGASAIQLVPELQRLLAESGGHLDVYQRTPNWVIPRNERAYTALEKRLFRTVPGLQRAVRGAVYAQLEARVPVFTRFPALMRVVEAQVKRRIAAAIEDPDLRAAVTPSYRAGCKRILISNRWYPALAADNVELVTDAITKLTPSGVVTADGTERPADVLVVATGFHVTEPPIATRITGREGRTLAQVWDGAGMAAYKGTTIHGFPNLFQVVGPNTALGHSSMIYVIESQVRYIVSALTAMRRDALAVVEPTRAAQESWTAAVRRRMRPTVWQTGGCASWYLDRFGNNTTLWPGQTFTFRRHLSAFDPAAYDVAPRRTSPSTRQEATA
ncbi:NAD(P)/FAD-dependent oxidoreductase [Nocardioides sp. zg-ZUI104]|uniref:flavin-containing monooxygenase n=1 Tax=Nocardioides faecalis TaxID=2803858 RepID=UPI001BCFC766|nr:NAD(P)/FAD-dependent oxidoreductase [Nocardioides faecalis]MBS4751724.1 NAD(P)/FAD-dependent oxidoreductase [Nocardioides faecalis]